MSDPKVQAEEAALDALIASFFVISDGDEFIPLDDPEILSAEDHTALAALGDDLVDRLVARSQS